MGRDQPDAYKNTGTPTTNQTSRAPNRTTRAAASKLMPLFLANSSLADLEALLLPMSLGTYSTTPINTKASRPDMTHREALKPNTSKSTPPMKKPIPFMAFLLPVNQATHLNNWPEPSPAVNLIADLLAVLVRSLATPHTPCDKMTQTTDIVAVQSGDKADSSRKPTICVANPTDSMRAIPNRVANQPPIKLATMPAAS